MFLHFSWSETKLEILQDRMSILRHASKAHTVLRMIKWAVGYDSPDYVKRQLYLSHVWSVLEYCSPVLSPYLVTEIASLEKVQRRATKFILNDFTDISYSDRCTKLSLLPLSFHKKYMISVLYLIAFMGKLIVTFRILII